MNVPYQNWYAFLDDVKALLDIDCVIEVPPVIPPKTHPFEVTERLLELRDAHALRYGYAVPEPLPQTIPPSPYTQSKPLSDKRKSMVAALLKAKENMK